METVPLRPLLTVALKEPHPGRLLRLLSPFNISGVFCNHLIVYEIRA
jgi:hypothetical protein